MNEIASLEESFCKAMMVAFDAGMWKVDSRFDTPLAEFQADDQEIVREVLQRFLVHVWDDGSIDNAPAIVKEFNHRLGGMMPGQLLYTSTPDDNDVIFCAWWPWGNGKKISIRIALTCQHLAQEQQAERLNSFKKRFGS